MVRIMTWNERNNPDLPRSQVQHDFKIAAGLKPWICGFQEIGEEQDHQDLRNAFPAKDYKMVFQSGAEEKQIPLVYNWHHIKMSEHHYVKCHPGLKNISPVRGFGWGIFHMEKRPKLKPFAVIWTHMVSGGWSPGHRQQEWRTKHWLIHWQKMNTCAKVLVEEGMSVFTLGDLNRINLPKGGWVNQRELNHHGLDHITFTPGKGKGVSVKIRPKSVKKFSPKPHVYTDHVPIGVSLDLDNK